MEDSSLFMQWAMDTLQHEHPAPAAVVGDVCSQATFPSPQPFPEPVAASYAAYETVQESLVTGAHAAAATGTWSWSSRDDYTTPGGHVLANSSWSGGTSSLPVSWNFSAVSPEPVSGGTVETTATTKTRALPEPAAYGSQMTPPPMRKAGQLIKSTGSTPTSAAAYAHEHIIAERKRREKINQRFIELSAVIPGLKKMDKATILSDATRYVKELQEKINSREAAGSGVVRSSATAILVKRPCHATPDEGVPAAAVRKPLPEIEAQLSGNNVMVRVLCENAKGVVARVLAEVEDLHLSIVDASVIPSPACALNITITAKVEAAFIVTAEQIISRVSSALSQQHT
ncbi:unnamed protein product [Urochloa decumbens]|uniref:BHLH domain-containing protein n=1 Tax=Urochloa decumbens TaxID=240449 RepID=A0ABC8WTD1_9POAL